MDNRNMIVLISQLDGEGGGSILGSSFVHVVVFGNLSQLPSLASSNWIIRLQVTNLLTQNLARVEPAVSTLLASQHPLLRYDNSSKSIPGYDPGHTLGTGDQEPQNHQMETDTSNTSIGGVLCIKTGSGNFLTVAYESQKLTDVECHYPIHDNELLVIVHYLVK
ncbi:hypothetical protein DSO57_1001990 [Entomophthora muscae]|uniref:Uncharacterized protein n=1 Tax=Entomophthora muscae TaxID=34485 RepID=A0ACC2RNT0_9FUNG|nr:hypothetical protein DSO57_1001990 [Entomophthora muscae]